MKNMIITEYRSLTLLLVVEWLCSGSLPGLTLLSNELRYIFLNVTLKSGRSNVIAHFYVKRWLGSLHLCLCLFYGGLKCYAKLRNLYRSRTYPWGRHGNRGRILERVKILIFEIIVVFTIISNIKILSLRLSVSAILEIFKMRLSVTFLLKLRQLPTCRNFYDELYQPTLQHVQWHLCLWRHTLCQVELRNVFHSLWIIY